MADIQQSSRTDSSAWPLGVACGLLLAVLSAIVWAMASLSLHLKMGYCSVAIGWLAGFGLLRGSGGRRGHSWMAVAAAFGLFGYSLGWYLVAATLTIRGHCLPQEVSAYVRSEVLKFVASHFREISS